LADDKFVKTKICSNIVEGVKKLFDDHLNGEFKKYDQTGWRNNVYWTEEVDIVYKVYYPIVKNLYMNFSGTQRRPGQRRFMTLDELSKLCLEGGIVIERNINFCFNLSTMTQIDELTSERIYQMYFVEFLEALARVADDVSLPPLGMSPDLPLDERKSQPLHLKLEAVIVCLMEKCIDKFTRDTYSIPTVSIFHPDFEEKYVVKKKSLQKLKVDQMNQIALELYQENININVRKMFGLDFERA
jgi:hypothetical protein